MLASNFDRSFERMLAFYGLEDTDGPGIVRRSTWPARVQVWLHPGNHNYLRLTRIIKSRILLGKPESARALFEALETEYQRGAAAAIGSETLAYWRSAASGA
jgi:hypothetical protein